MTSANYKETSWVYYKEKDEDTYRMVKPYNLTGLTFSDIKSCGKCGKIYGTGNIILMEFGKTVCELCYNDLNRVKLTLW